MISAPGRRAVVLLFEAIADALVVIIGWVLWLAPLGVLALAYTVGAAAGGSAFAGLGHYVVLISAIGILVTLAGYPLAIIAGRVGPAEFTRAMIGPQAVAISTRSSLASLPAMLAAARTMGDPRASRRRVPADRGRAVPRDGSGDECRRGLLCRALARLSSRASRK